MDFLEVAFVLGVSSYSEATPLGLVKLRPNNVNQNNLVWLKIFFIRLLLRRIQETGL